MIGMMKMLLSCKYRAENGDFKNGDMPKSKLNNFVIFLDFIFEIFRYFIEYLNIFLK